MNKEQLLNAIKYFAAKNLASRDEVLSAYDEGTSSQNRQIDKSITHHLSIAEVLYYIGGAIVFIGIFILIAQNWTTLSTFSKITASLGAGVAAYIIGVIFNRDEKLDGIGQAFHLIAALVTPIGLYVTFNSAGFDVSGWGLQSLISGILLAVYLLSFLIFRKALFLIFTIIFATWSFFALTSFLVGSSPVFNTVDFIEYRFLIAGLSYILIGYFFTDTIYRQLKGVLFAFGILFILGSTLALGGWEPQQNIFWELIYPGLVFGTIFLSVYLKAKSFLTFGAIYLMIYIIKITAEYFTEGLGWPIALVVAGFLLIIVGYITFYINSHYLSHPSST